MILYGKVPTINKLNYVNVINIISYYTILMSSTPEVLEEAKSQDGSNYGSEVDS